MTDREHLDRIQRWTCWVLVYLPLVSYAGLGVGITRDAIAGDWGGVFWAGVLLLLIYWNVTPIAAEARRSLEENPDAP